MPSPLSVTTGASEHTTAATAAALPGILISAYAEFAIRYLLKFKDYKILLL